MNDTHDTRDGAGPLGPCASPEVGDLLPDFIIGLLSAEAAEGIRAHLEVCGRCAWDYDEITGLRAVARKLFAAAAGSAGPARGSTRPVVRHISDYKK